jgi:hypothetical protein
MYEKSTEAAAYDDNPAKEYYDNTLTDSWKGHDFDHRFTGWGRYLYAYDSKKLSE